MTLTQKFSLLCLVVLCLFGAAIFWVVSSLLTDARIQRARELTAAYVRQEALHEFTLEDISEPKTGERYQTFRSRIGHLSLGPDIMELRVWNAKGEVVWAKDEEIVGRTFADNVALARALSGEVVAEWSRLDDRENNFAKSDDWVMELYVPVRFRDNEVGAVFEVYENTHELQAEIAAQRRAITVYTIIGTLTAYFMLLGLVARASRTLRRQTRQIAESEERVKGLLEAAYDAIVAAGRDGAVLLVNQAAVRTFHLGACTGQPNFLQLFREDTRTEVAKAVDRLMAGEGNGGGTHLEGKGLRQDTRDPFPLEISLSSSGYNGNRLVTAILRDTSERKALELKLIEGERQQMAALMASAIGHELNNSVSALMGYGELLLEEAEEPDAVRSSAEVILAEGQTLAAHAMNLLELGKPRAPKMEPIALAPFVDDVLQVLTESGVLKHVEVRSDHEDSLPPVKGDRGLLEQVFRNLAINAAQAMEEGGAFTVTTRANGDGEVIVSLADQGPGVDAEILPHLFEPFRTSKGDKGTGLGLYISQQIVTDHHGRLTVDSHQGRGTTVEVHLPAAGS